MLSVKTTLNWSQEYSQENVSGYRLEGYYLDIMIKYLDRGAGSFEAHLFEMDDTFIQDEEPEAQKFVVYENASGLWRAHNGYDNFIGYGYNRDEAVLNSWLQRFMVKHFDAMVVR